MMLSNPVQPAFAPDPAGPAVRNAGYVANYVPQTANGIATWYGGGFHGNVTYCGHIYDMYDPTTAASTDFPCGTWLTVTNVSNGAAIMVQVKDRGLLGPGHVDLSLAAFSAIASPGDGVIGISVSNRGLR
jgi:rare lipoprotein A